MAEPLGCAWQAGELTQALETIKWGTDYLLNCHSAPYQFVAMLGASEVCIALTLSPCATAQHHCCCGRRASQCSTLWLQQLACKQSPSWPARVQVDFGYFGPPEEHTQWTNSLGKRVGTYITPDNPSSEICGEVAAALAAASIALKSSEPAYAGKLHAAKGGQWHSAPCSFCAMWPAEGMPLPTSMPCGTPGYQLSCSAILPVLIDVFQAGPAALPCLTPKAGLQRRWWRTHARCWSLGASTPAAT